MPYVPPRSYPLSNKDYKGWPSKKITLGNPTDKTCTGSTTNDDRMISSRDNGVPPRRKSAPEFYSREPNLKVDLQFSKETLGIVRKKNGEVVKPSLKKDNSKSTFPKYVFFNTDLEQVRFFNGAKAVNADASFDEDTDDDDDDDGDDDDDDDDDGDDDDDDNDIELGISLPNMPLITTVHDSKPVFLESVSLSQDKKSLQGRIIVQNIAFQKIVDIKYTFDFWSSVSEVSASYAEDLSLKEDKNRFVFDIELIDNSRNPIDGKIMYLAAHYNVNGHDFWDNNNGSNYQVNFKRVSTLSNKDSPVKSQNISSNWSMLSTSRPKNLDDSFCRSPSALNSSKLLTGSRKKSLKDHYDIDASLSAAQNASRPSLDSSNAIRTFQPSVYPEISFFLGNYIDGVPDPLALPSSPFQLDDNAQNHNSNPIAIPSPKPIIGSSSYHELLNQYCFHSGSPYGSPYTTSPVM